MPLAVYGKERHVQRLIQRDEVAAWCARWLGAQPTNVLFEVAHLSRVTGLRLADGREVVVKARSPADRIQACVHVQRHLWAAGFPCPQPFAGPHPLGPMTATAEALVPGGTRLEPGADSPKLFAEALAALPTLAPPPAWIFWDHDQPGIWPLPDDRDDDLNRHPGPVWLDEVGRRARRCLRVAGRIMQFYTLRAQSLVKARYREPSSRDLFAPICKQYGGLAVWVVCKHPEGC
jgi:hypothetical protein